MSERSADGTQGWRRVWAVTRHEQEGWTLVALFDDSFTADRWNRLAAQAEHDANHRHGDEYDCMKDLEPIEQYWLWHGLSNLTPPVAVGPNEMTVLPVALVRELK